MFIRETAYDYDNCLYFVARDEGSDLVKFAFSCNCTKAIFANGGQEMLDELYKGIKSIEVSDNKFDRLLNSQDRMVRRVRFDSRNKSSYTSKDIE